MIWDYFACTGFLCSNFVLWLKELIRVYREILLLSVHYDKRYISFETACVLHITTVLLKHIMVNVLVFAP